MVGAELFVENAALAGSRLGLTRLAEGLLLAGGEPEELITAVIAALRGQGGTAAGDAIGASITMLSLVVGLIIAMDIGTSLFFDYRDPAMVSTADAKPDSSPRSRTRQSHSVTETQSP